MDKLLDHIGRTAMAHVPRNRVLAFVTGFRQDEPPRWRELPPIQFPFPRESILGVMDRCLVYDGFNHGRGIDHDRDQILAKIEGRYGRNEGFLTTVEGLLSETLELKFEVQITVSESGSVVLRMSSDLMTWVEEWVASVRRELAKTDPGRLGATAAVRHNPVLGPGEELTGAYSGRLLDYSGCAGLGELGDLVKSPGDDKVLPLGVFAFDPKPELAGSRPPALFLSRYRTKALMAYNGTLVVAPQNSGKTELIVRWAIAANRGNYSTFIVDVKGTLHDRLVKEGLRGRVCHFTTDPDPMSRSHRLNFLEGLDPITAVGRKGIDQLVQAILPREGNEQGEDLGYWLVRTKWLAAFINLRKLFDHYYGTTSDLGDVYELANDESILYKCIRDLFNAERYRRENQPGIPPVVPGAAAWVRELAVLIDPHAEGIPGGSREPRYSYATLTINISTALQPFSRHGTLHARTSGRSDFTLGDLDGVEQVTIILAAREQDLEDSRTVVSMAIKRLEQILFDRRKKPAPDHEVLLLLDETRRIRSFKAGEYITFARDAKAGCVLVYQSISQIRSEEEVSEILENVGTQIYLRTLTGSTARRFIENLPKKGRPTYSLGSSRGPDGVSTSIQTGQEIVNYFTTAELYRLPAGDYPALVYIKDHGEGRPFLVDMSKEALEEHLK